MHFHRSRAESVADYGDARRGSPLGLLDLKQLLTPLQVEAARIMARVYAAFERWHGQTRNPHAPGYVRSALSDQPDDAEPNDPFEPLTADEIDEKQRRADKRYARLSALIDGFPNPKTARAQLEQLCIDDEAVHSSFLPSIRYALDHIAADFIDGAKLPASMDMRISARRPMRRARDRGDFVKRPDLAKEAYMKCQRKLSPHLDEAALEHTWTTLQDMTHALKHRAGFQREKLRHRK